MNDTNTIITARHAMQARADISGGKYGRLTVLRAAGTAKYGRRWLCRCDCGAFVTVCTANLMRRGRPTRSCGCLRREKARQRRQHGHTVGGLSKTYYAWLGMLSRCGNPKSEAYPYYGGRGIAVCERWHDFANFLADMGEVPPGLTLDRIDNEKGYFPGNCRWATRSEQARNRRNSIRVSFGGETLNLYQWAERIGLRPGTLKCRLQRWPVEKALTAPLRRPPASR